MSNIFYEDGGQFKLATVIQKNNATYQADTQHGKRIKVKTNNVFIEFDGDMNAFMQTAESEANEIDTELLWECVGTEEFDFQAAAKEYFGNQPSQTQLAATLIALYAAPMYFYKKSKGVFKAAPEDILKQAIIASERKVQQEMQMQTWVDEMISGNLPEAIAIDLPHILHAPDKQTLTYKAFQMAANELKMSPYEVARHIGGVASMSQYLLQRFEYKYFPQGTQFPVIAEPKLPVDLSVANVQAFSIDDRSTTEVDDALSLQDLGQGVKRVGIHIAAPSLSVEPDSEIEKIILQRLSTVYFPANKITMLPENWIDKFSLDEGKIVPAFSIYFDVDEQWQLSEPVSKIELVPIETNLRIQDIEPFFNSETGVGCSDNPQFKHHADCLYLLQLSYELQKQRDRLEDASLPKKYEYSIDFDAEGKVVIIRRERGSPIDTLVSEMMILANTSWAKMLHDNQLAGLFRVQPSGRVRMSTYSEPHIGMNLVHYGWFTSPLRRASDYINQKQLQSVLQDDCKPRFANNDSDLFVAVSNFEAAYSAYRAFQDMMESYWSMVWIKQENISEIKATVLKEDLVRLEGVPLVARATGIPMEITPKSMIKLAITGIEPDQQFIGLKYLSVIPTVSSAVDSTA